MRVIGTAGHVDHGKSTLVEALTGINPDRLKEEQEREMTIDLGFAWLKLPSGQTVSLVDVPGHEAFIKNMLAGVGGIDAALLVIAADEGIMPQTREHLAILDLLQVQGGVVALTKVDVATEPGWVELVEAEIRASLAGTVLAGAPIVRVSARTGFGLDSIKLELDRSLAHVEEKADRGRPRLPVDRVFTLAGFGTVVTGTLGDGSLSVGDEIEILPRALKARIRGIETHREKLVRAAPGGRVGVNLSGVAKEDVNRGDAVVLPGSYSPTQMFDARVRWLESAPKPLSNNQKLDLFVFATQVPVRVRLLQTGDLAKGRTGLAQILAEAPVVVAKGDRFVMRYASPSITVGGGTVIDAHPRRRHRRGRGDVIADLERAEKGTPEELVLQYSEAHNLIEAREVEKALGLSSLAVEQAVSQLVESGQLIPMADGRLPEFMARTVWQRWRDKFQATLEDYHRKFALRPGIPREEFKSRLAFPVRAFEPLIGRAAAEGLVRYNDKVVWLATHQIKFNPDTQGRIDKLLEMFRSAPYAPPSANEIEEQIGSEALGALVEQARLIRISSQVILTPDAERAMMDWVVAKIREKGQVTAGELRDQFNTSRKYAIAFLEYLDQKHVTRRVGDARVLR